SVFHYYYCLRFLLRRVGFCLLANDYSKIPKANPEYAHYCKSSQNGFVPNDFLYNLYYCILADKKNLPFYRKLSTVFSTHYNLQNDGNVCNKTISENNLLLVLLEAKTNLFQLELRPNVSNWGNGFLSVATNDHL